MRYEHIPERIIKQGQQIWDAHEYAGFISWRNHRLGEYANKLIMKLPDTHENRITSIEN